MYKALGLSREAYGPGLAHKIQSCEEKLSSSTGSTLTQPSIRDDEFREDEKRRELRKQILDELLHEYRLDNDDDIRLKHGGARPKEITMDKQAFIVTGLPASGKSSISNRLADKYGAYIVDSDYAKRKFPEFGRHEHGASLVHDEASEVIFGSDSDGGECLLYALVAFGANVVTPTIGYDCDRVLKLRDDLRKHGYSVHLVLVSVERHTSTIRAIDRFNRTNRYIPLALIYDSYANDPTLSYYRIRDDENWESVNKFCTENERKVIYASAFAHLDGEELKYG